MTQGKENRPVGSEAATQINSENHTKSVESIKAEAGGGGLNIITLAAFLIMKIPPREMILDPIIPTQGLVMIYGQRGMGKTLMAIFIALAVAAGLIIMGGRWKAHKPRRVLFVDGEMPAISLQERLAKFVYSFGIELPSSDFLRLITPDLQTDYGIPDLATPEGQAAIEKHLDGVELLILDNLSALVRMGKENEAESWRPLQTWLLSLRKRGISVLIVHHANKNGEQRGTSKKEDLLDTVIALKRPEDYETKQGARFNIQYEKARGFRGDAAEPFEAYLVEEEGKFIWQIRDLENTQATMAKELEQAGLSQREIGKELGCSAAKVNRLLKEETKPKKRDGE